MNGSGDRLPGALPIWERLQADLGAVTERKPGYYLLQPAFQLFADAIAAFDGGAVLASALACRASVESAEHILLTRHKWPTGTPYWIRLDETRKGTIRKVPHTERIEKIRGQEVLEPDLLAALARIKEDGDFVAHLAERHDKDLESATQQVRARGARDAVPDVTPRRMHPTVLEVYRNLDDCARILREFVLEIEVPDRDSSPKS